MPKTNQERIEERQKIRAEINKHIVDCKETSLLLISESIDNYIEHQIEADKVLEGILKDIQANTATIAETRIDKLLAVNLN